MSPKILLAAVAVLLTLGASFALGSALAGSGDDEPAPAERVTVKAVERGDPVAAGVLPARVRVPDLRPAPKPKRTTTSSSQQSTPGSSATSGPGPAPTPAGPDPTPVPPNPTPPPPDPTPVDVITDGGGEG